MVGALFKGSCFPLITIAKQDHPDLHPELTDPALKFRRIDSAYHRLEQHRHLF